VIAEFAQIVGLLSAFTSGRKTDEILSIAEFLQWLTEHNHEEIKCIVEQNQTTVTSIKALLNDDIKEIKNTLEGISKQVAVLSVGSDGLGQLAKEFATEMLSNQAIEILRLMDRNQTEFFLLSRAIGRKEQQLLLVPGVNYTCSESRFLKDDLEVMTALGLLIEDHNSKGEPMYYFTRSASDLVNSMEEAS
jgi:hypothetical protein